MFASARNDLRIAFRQLSKAPGFSLTVVLTFALGIGATTAIFSLVEGILLRPLPFHDPARLVLLGDRIGNTPNLPATARDIGTYSRATTAFSSIGAYSTASFELSGDAVPRTVPGAHLTASAFSTLGVHPIVGRVFTQQEADGNQPFAVISYALWVNRYHRDPRVAGATITLDRRNYTILGVMPRSFEFPLLAGRIGQARLWLPLTLTPHDLSDEQAGVWGYHIVARLRDGVSLQQASQDADRVAREIMREYPSNMASIHIRGDVLPLRDSLVADARPLLRALFLAVAVVLLIACVNVATLLLVRALRRRREHAVRLALGARPAVILRECVSEGLLLSLSGGFLGLSLAAATLHTALRWLPESLPRIDSVSIDPAVAAFALLLAVLTGTLCSLAPAFAAIRTNLLESLRDDVRSGTRSLRQGWLSSALVVAEIAIALVLLSVSLAFVRSYQKMLAVDPGFRADHVLVAGYQLPARQYSTGAAIANFNREVVDRLSAQPSIVAVAITDSLPATGDVPEAAYTIEGVPLGSWKLKFSQFIVIEGDYFRAMGIPLISGRFFTVRDRSSAPLVVIVNQSMAKSSWPGQDPLGRRMHVGNPRKGLPWATVVGVVADTRIGSPDQPPENQWYFPVEQPAILTGSSATDVLAVSAGYIVLRSTLPPEQMIRTLRSVVAGIDPQLPLDPVRPMADAVSNIEAPRRFNTQLIASFALAALLLAAMGIYAVMAFSVSLRSQEIAIRMALGAQRSNIAALILASGAKIALAGCVLGVLGSLAVSRLVAAFLFEVSATHPVIDTFSVLIMLLLALCASALPARRAAASDPGHSLRAQ